MHNKGRVKLPGKLHLVYIPLALFVINFLVRLIFLGSGDLSGDEPYSVFVAQGSIGEINEFLKGENNPPIHFYLLHFWVKLFGISAYSVRFPSLIFSAFTAGVIYRMGVKFLNLRIAILAAIIYSLANYQIYFAHEARVYSLFVLLTCLSFHFFLSAHQTSKRKYWVFLTLMNVLLIYSHFFGIFVIFTQMFSTIFVKEYRNKLFRGMVISSLVTALSYLPYLTIILTRFGHTAGNNWVPSPNIESLYNLLWTYSNEPVITVMFLAILVYGLVAYMVRRRRKEIVSNRKLFVIWFLVPYLTMFFISYKMPIFMDRYLLFVSIGYYFSVAIALDFILVNKERLFFYISSAIMLLMAITTNLKSGHNNEASQIAQEVKKRYTSETSIIILPEWYRLEFIYHFDTSIFKNVKDLNSELVENHMYPCLKLYDLDQSWRQKKVVLIDSGSELTDPEKTSLKTLQEDYVLIDEVNDFHHTTLYFFELK